jgi:hypothetical protein
MESGLVLGLFFAKQLSSWQPIPAYSANLHERLNLSTARSPALPNYVEPRRIGSVGSLHIVARKEHFQRLASLMSPFGRTCRCRMPFSCECHRQG